MLQFQGELPSVLGSSLDELMRHVGSLRSQVLEVVINIYSMLCELGSSSPSPAQETCSQVALHQLFLKNSCHPCRGSCCARCARPPAEKAHSFMAVSGTGLDRPHEAWLLDVWQHQSPPCTGDFLSAGSSNHRGCCAAHGHRGRDQQGPCISRQLRKVPACPCASFISTVQWSWPFAPVAPFPTRLRQSLQCCCDAEMLQSHGPSCWVTATASCRQQSHSAYQSAWLLCSAEKPADYHAYLSECIMHSARLLESLSSNSDFATKFVDQGGLQLLLRLYTLRHLPATFGSSAAAHALVAAVRVLNQAATSSVTNSKVVEALTGQLRTTLLLGMVSTQEALDTTLRNLTSLKQLRQALKMRSVGHNPERPSTAIHGLPGYARKAFWGFTALRDAHSPLAEGTSICLCTKS